MSQMACFTNQLFELSRRTGSSFVFVTCDSINSFGLQRFKEEFPERIIDVGIAEAAAVNIAFGIWKTGLKVFVAAFSNFLALRALEQIRTYIAYHKADVTLLATKAGITAAQDGVTHIASEDLCILRTIPHLNVYTPSDDAQTASLASHCITSSGPKYVRLVRQAVVTNFRDPEVSRCPASRCYMPVRWIFECPGSLAICSYGVVLQECIQAAQVLREEYSVNSSVCEVSQQSPLPAAWLKKELGKYTHVVICEDQQERNGIGVELKELLPSTRILLMNLGGRYVLSDDFDKLLKAFSLDCHGIAQSIRGWLGEM